MRIRTYLTHILRIVLGVFALACHSIPANAEPPSISAFVGILTSNTWTDVAFRPFEVELVDSFIGGVGFNYPLGETINLKYGSLGFLFEPQITAHAGVQDLIQLDLPVTARYALPKRTLGVDSLSFGIGPSVSTRVPQIERNRGDGEAKNTLVYWKIEIGHDLADDRNSSVFFRLHHRSSGFGLVGNSGSSNALVVGFRTAL